MIFPLQKKAFANKEFLRCLNDPHLEVHYSVLRLHRTWMFNCLCLFHPAPTHLSELTHDLDVVIMWILLLYTEVCLGHIDIYYI